MIKVNHSLVPLSGLVAIIVNSIQVHCGSQCGLYAESTRGLIYWKDASRAGASSFLHRFSIINGVYIEGVEYLIVSKLQINLNNGTLSAYERDTHANYHDLLRSIHVRRPVTIFSDEPEKSYWGLMRIVNAIYEVEHGPITDIQQEDKDRRFIGLIRLHHGTEDIVPLIPVSITHRLMVLRLYYLTEEIQISYFLRRSTPDNLAIGTIGLSRSSVVEGFKAICNLSTFLARERQLPYYIIPIDQKYGVIIYSDHKYVIDNVEEAMHLTSDRHKMARYFEHKKKKITKIDAIIVNPNVLGQFRIIDARSSIFNVSVERWEADVISSEVYVQAEEQAQTQDMKKFITSMRYRHPLTTITDSLQYYYSVILLNKTHAPSSPLRVQNIFVQMYLGRLVQDDRYDQFYNRVHSLIIVWPNGKTTQYSYHFLMDSERKEWLISFHINKKKILLDPKVDPLTVYSLFAKEYHGIPIHIIPFHNDYNSLGIALYPNGKYMYGKVSQILRLTPVFGLKKPIPLNFDCFSLKNRGGHSNVYYGP